MFNKKMVKRAQFAIEYLIIGTFIFFGISVAMYAVYTNVGKQSQELEIAELKEFGNSIITVTNDLGYMGSESRKTLELILPDNVVDVFVENDKYLIFKYQAGDTIVDIPFESKLPLAIDFEDLNPGVKNMFIETRDQYILVCSKRGELSCDNLCSVTEGETAANNPNDCCKSDCTECTNDANYYFCISDSLCHAACDNHNDCNGQCDWNASLLWENFCYNCTPTCMWGNQKPCPTYCVNATALQCGVPYSTHTLDQDEYCNHGAVCSIGNCSYSGSAYMDGLYCYFCNEDGAGIGDYCPPSGTYINDFCYYGVLRQCGPPSNQNCSLSEFNMTLGFEYYDLHDGALSWRLDNESQWCEYGPDACTSSGSGLIFAEDCPWAGYKDMATGNCYYESGGTVDRSDDCSAVGCQIQNDSGCALGYCHPTLGCI